MRIPPISAIALGSSASRWSLGVVTWAWCSGYWGISRPLGTTEGWGSALTIAVGTAAVMAIYPRIAALFAQAFTYLAQASRQFASDGPATRSTSALTMPAVTARRLRCSAGPS